MHRCRKGPTVHYRLHAPALNVNCFLCCRVSASVSNCLTRGIRTPRDLLHRIEEVYKSRVKETRTAMRLYAHYKHGYVWFRCRWAQLGCHSVTVTVLPANALNVDFFHVMAA